MLQVLRKGLKDIVVEEVPEPLVGFGEVKIKTAYSLISTGTEVAGLHPEGLMKEVIQDRKKIGTLIGRALRSQGVAKTAQAIFEKFSELSMTGYSGSGVVIEKSPEVIDIEIGDKVAYGGVETGHAEIVCASRNLVAQVPNDVSLREACLTTLGSISLHAVRNTQITIGDTVAVIGLGLIGQLVVQLARLQGARVFGVDLNKERIKQAIKHGAEVALEASEDPEDVFYKLTGGQGVDSVIICASSKTSEPLELAVEIARSRARIVVVGMIKMEIPWESLYLKELHLSVSRAYGPGSYDQSYEKKGIDYPIDYVRWTENRNMQEFLRLLGDGRIKSEGIITQEFPLDKAPTVFQQLASGDQKILGAVLSYPDCRSSDSKERNREVTVRTVTSHRKASSSPEIMKVGIIGLGNISRWVHLPNIKRHPALMLKGVCTPKGYKAKHFGVRYKSEYCTTEYKKIIEDPEIDLVMICTRNDLHASIAQDALKAGKHVFVEKPMAMTREDCLKLIQLVQETGLGLMVNFNRRYAPMYKKAKEATAGSTPMMISIRMNNPDMTPKYWMMDPRTGGGAVLGEGCHFFDLMAWLTDSNPVSVFASELSLNDDKVTSRNNIMCVVSFEDGSVGNLVYETVGHKGFGSERLEICTDGKSVVVDDMKRLVIWKGSGSSFKSPRSQKNLRAKKGYYDLLGDFIDGMKKGRSFQAEVISGAQATLCALAAMRSIETGMPQKVECF